MVLGRVPDPRQSENRCDQCGELIDDDGNCGCDDQEWADFFDKEEEDAK